MAKQGSIRHYRQAGAAPEPEQLPYSELAVAKDGSLYAGDENGRPVKVNAQADRLATARTITLSGGATGSGSFDGGANLSIATTVAWASVTGKPGTFAPAAHNQAAGTITAGTFPAAVVAADVNASGAAVRNVEFQTAAGGVVSASKLVVRRK